MRLKIVQKVMVEQNKSALLMDKLFGAVISSPHPDGLKRQLIEKLIQGSASNPIPEEECCNLLSLAVEWILEGDKPYIRTLGMQAYVAWGQFNRDTLVNFFSAHLLLKLLSDTYTHQANVIELIQETFRLLRGMEELAGLLKIVQTKAISFVRENANIQVICNLSKLMLEFPDAIPYGEFTTTFCIAIIHCVSVITVPKNAAHIPALIKDVSTVGELLHYIWDKNDPEIIFKSLRAVYSVISEPECEVEPSIALGALVHLLPLEMIDVITKNVITDNTIRDASMATALMRMIDWLSWPTAKNVDQWVIALLKGMASIKKFILLIQVTEARIEQVYEKLKYPVVRGSALEVLSHMLLSFQHSPEAFHKIVNSLPEMVQVLREENSESSHQTLEQLSELLHCLMHLHAGFPDLYDPIVEAFKDFSKPSLERIKQLLNQNKWTSQRNSSTSDLSSKFCQRSDTNKTGLINLGNTCYMNSIVQTLFMCDGFRNEVLCEVPSSTQLILLRLQYLFAFLALTQRAAYAPVAFLQASRPPWFETGHQQDCSEFLRHLLDQLHEQEKQYMKKAGIMNKVDTSLNLAADESISKSPANSSYKEKLRSFSSRNTSLLPDYFIQGIKGHISEDDTPTLVYRTFGGKLVTIYQCLNCKNVSRHLETFTDLHLAFPNTSKEIDDSAKLDRPMYQTREATRNAVKKTTSNSKSNQNGEHEDKTTKDQNDNLSIEDLIEFYLAPERLEGDNKYHCENCNNLQDAVRHLKIVESPKHLILTLLRFSYNAKTQSRSKVFTDIKFPRTLRLPVERRNFNSAKSPISKRSKNISSLQKEANAEAFDIFTLHAVVVHSGMSSECGHYYTYARHTTPSPEEYMETNIDENDELDLLPDRWYLFNDSRVSFSSYSSFGNVTKRFPKDTAYLLFYKRMSEMDMTNEGTPPELVIRRELREVVDKDNSVFLQEQELEARSDALRRNSNKSSSSSSSFPWKDFDDRNNPPGSCGGSSGGGPGGIDSSISRFVF